MTNNLPSVMTISGVHGYLDQNGTAWLNAEDVARGLGFVEVKKNRSTKSVDTSVDNHPTYIMWNRVNGYLAEYDYPPVKAGDFIPENIFYRLAMKASNEAAQKFQAKVADEILPQIRKTGMYNVQQKPMSAVEVLIMAARAAEEQQKQLVQLQSDVIEVKDNVSALTEATEEISQRLEREIQNAASYDTMLDVDHAKTKERVSNLEGDVLDIKDQLVDITALPKTMWPDIQGCVGAMIKNLSKYEGLTERQARQRATEDILGDISAEAGHTRTYIGAQRKQRRAALLRQGVSESTAKSRVTCNTIIDTDPALKIAAAKVIQSYNRTIAALEDTLVL